MNGDREGLRLALFAASLLLFMWFTHAIWSVAFPDERSAINDQRMRGLQSVHEGVWNFAACKGRLPSTLIELIAAGYGVPMVGSAGDTYLYTRISGTAYRLCSIFPKDDHSPSLCFEIPLHIPRLKTVDGMPPEDVRSAACRYRA